MLKELQEKVGDWIAGTCGYEVLANKQERNARFFEEAVEFVQTRQMTVAEMIAIILDKMTKPVGEPKQEAGGVIITFLGACESGNIDAQEAFDQEWNRVQPMEVRNRIAAKSALKLPNYDPPEEDGKIGVIEFDYLNHRNELTSKRRIVPLYPWYGNSEWYPKYRHAEWFIRGLDIEKNKVRDFMIDRMSFVDHVGAR